MGPRGFLKSRIQRELDFESRAIARYKKMDMPLTQFWGCEIDRGHSNEYEPDQDGASLFAAKSMEFAV